MHTLLRAVLFGGLLASTAWAAEKPTLTNLILTPADLGTATLSATVTANGAFTTVVFSYGLTEQFGSTAQATVNADAVDRVVTVNLSGLIGGQKYFVKVVATNALGSNTLTGDFTELAYAAALGTPAASHKGGGKVVFTGSLVANGTPGEAYFEYGLTIPYGSETARVPIAAGDNPKTLELTVTGLDLPATYNFRLTFKPTDPLKPTQSTANFTFATANIPPIAEDDTVLPPKPGALVIDVLKNDSDPDNNPLLLATVTTPAHGSARITDNRIRYTPGADFRGNDTFTYTIEDGFGGSDTATVTIRSVRIAVAGTHGGVILEASGKVIGYFRITATEGGSFTGSVLIDGERQAIAGTLSADGKFQGSIFLDGRSVAVSITAEQDGTTTNIAASFDGGRWTSATATSESEATRRGELAGRYTVEFSGGGSGTGGGGSTGSDGTTMAAVAPEGSGWAVVKLAADGTARVKGKLADGRAFSTDGVLAVTGASTAISFFDDPRHTRVIGSLTVGDSVSGTLEINRNSAGRGKFSKGYDVSQTATGAPYLTPEDGQRALEGDGTASGRQLTITVSPGGEGTGFTRELRVGKDDKVKVLDPGAEDLSVKFDRRGGRFTIKFTGDTDDKRFKGSGVLIQSTSADGLGRGAGLVLGDTQTGKITIAGSSGTTTGTGTGTGTGTVTVTP